MADIQGINFGNPLEPVVTLKLSRKEYEMIGGEYEGVALIGRRDDRIDSNVLRRGTDDETTYIRIPKHLRYRLGKNTPCKVSRVDLPGRTVFITEVLRDLRRPRDEKASSVEDVKTRGRRTSVEPVQDDA